MLALVPVVIFIALGWKILELERELAEVKATMAKLQYTISQYADVQGGQEEPATEIVETPKPVTETPAADVQTSEPPAEVIEEPVTTEQPLEVTEASRKVYLTFDDGPSVYTTEILDILDEYDVKATFFVLGKEDETSVELIQEIYERGHTVGMHSYSHKYNEIYASKEAFIADYRKIRNFLSEMVGVESFCYRFPGGSSNTISSVDMLEFADYLDEQGVTYHDWNISSGDGGSTVLTPEQIQENVLKDIEKFRTAVVLMHDAPEKYSTVEALPGILEALLAMEDTAVLPITEDSVAVQHIQRETN